MDGTRKANIALPFTPKWPGAYLAVEHKLLLCTEQRQMVSNEARRCSRNEQIDTYEGLMETTTVPGNNKYRVLFDVRRRNVMWTPTNTVSRSDVFFKTSGSDSQKNILGVSWCPVVGYQTERLQQVIKFIQICSIGANCVLGTNFHRGPGTVA